MLLRELISPITINNTIKLNETSMLKSILPKKMTISEQHVTFLKIIDIDT
jgi:hypothetical protein